MPGSRRKVVALQQKNVDAIIQNVGGYWRPINGLARLLEELGELAEKVGKVGDHADEIIADEIAEEFADLWIISTCIANQFNVDLGTQRVHSAGEAKGTMGELLVAAGVISRIVNYYDGPKTPRSVADWPTLGQAIAQFHLILRKYAEECDVDLGRAIDRKTEKIPGRDAGRFRPSYDPSTSEVLKAFEAVRGATICPYAPKAKLWGAPKWDPGRSLEWNIEALIPYLTIFAKAADREELDGFIVAPLGDYDSNGMQGLADWFGDLLGMLIKKESLTPYSDVFNGIGTPGWQFSFYGVRMFVSVFSPFYSQKHPRYSQGGNYVLFQPEASFDANRIGSKYPSSNGAKQSIRRQFAEAGLDYPYEVIDQRNEAQIYLLPRWSGDESVFWWRRM